MESLEIAARLAAAEFRQALTERAQRDAHHAFRLARQQTVRARAETRLLREDLAAALAREGNQAVPGAPPAPPANPPNIIAPAAGQPVIQPVVPAPVQAGGQPVVAAPNQPAHPPPAPAP